MPRIFLAGVIALISCSPKDSKESATTTTNVTTSAGPTPEPTTSDDGGVGDSVATDSHGGASSGEPSEPSSSDGLLFDLGSLPDLPDSLTKPQLWYSLEDLLVYVELAPADGSVVQFVASKIVNEPPLGSANDGISSSLTMLADGSLLGARGTTNLTQFYHVPEPPTVATEVTVTMLGSLPIYIEALHVDCDGRVYLMDTGVDNVSPDKNRLLRLIGDYLAGDFAYVEIGQLEKGGTDIDDMAPGIGIDGDAIDNPGLAIDDKWIHRFDYSTGDNNPLLMAGTYGIHVLGGPLFDDGVSRVYVTDIDGRFYTVDLVKKTVSPSLAMGPSPMNNVAAGLTGITGPLTECITGFPQG